MPDILLKKWILRYKWRKENYVTLKKKISVYNSELDIIKGSLTI